MSQHRDNLRSVPVASVNNKFEAELIVGLLKSAGVRAFLLADDAGGQEPQWQLSGGVQILVPSREVTAAREVLDDVRRRESRVD